MPWQLSARGTICHQDFCHPIKTQVHARGMWPARQYTRCSDSTRLPIRAHTGEVLHQHFLTSLLPLGLFFLRFSSRTTVSPSLKKDAASSDGPATMSKASEGRRSINAYAITKTGTILSNILFSVHQLIINSTLLLAKDRKRHMCTQMEAKAYR